MLYISETGLATVDHPASAMKLLETIQSFFYKQLGSGLSHQSCLYFQVLGGLELFDGCLIVWTVKLCLQGI